jgi:ribonuclease P protein component
VIPPTGPFPRETRIRRSAEFREIKEVGCRHSSGAFVLLVRSTTGAGVARLGITASRKVGNAVARNRVKRRIREWFRRCGQARLAGLDVVVIARAAAATLSGPATFDELSRIARGVR